MQHVETTTNIIISYPYPAFPKFFKVEILLFNHQNLFWHLDISVYQACLENMVNNIGTAEKIVYAMRQGCS